MRTRAGGSSHGELKLSELRAELLERGCFRSETDSESSLICTRNGDGFQPRLTACRIRVVGQKRRVFCSLRSLRSQNRFYTVMGKRLRSRGSKAFLALADVRYDRSA